MGWRDSSEPSAVDLGVAKSAESAVCEAGIGDGVILDSRRIIPAECVAFSELHLTLVFARIFGSKDEEFVHVVNGILHNTLHLTIGDVRVLLPSKTGRAWFPGVKVFDRPIPERKGNDSLRFPREFIASAIRGIHCQVDCSTFPLQSNRTRMDVYRVAANCALVKRRKWEAAPGPRCLLLAPG